MNQNKNEDTHKSKQIIPNTETLRANGEDASSCKFYSCMVGVQDQREQYPTAHHEGWMVRG